MILDWLKRIAASDVPPHDVVAFNIGLFETEHGYSAHLVGSRRYDTADDDWACDEDFLPSERYCDIPLATQDEGWEAVRDRVANELRTHLSTSNGKASFLGRAKAVTVGFDDGDLLLVS